MLKSARQMLKSASGEGRGHQVYNSQKLLYNLPVVIPWDGIAHLSPSQIPQVGERIASNRFLKDAKRESG